MICPTSREIIDKTNSHVDHFEPSFDELVRDFIDKYKIKLDADLFPPERDNQVVYSITDEMIMSDFIEYHRNNANLRMLSINGNLQRGK